MHCMEELKVEDLVFCKKRYSIKNKVYFIPNKQYMISYISGDNIDIMTPYGEDHITFVLKREKRKIWVCPICPVDDCYKPVLSKYFCGIKESRKLKLKKLKKIPNRV